MSVPSDPNRLIIFDTTLRDGEQSPGCSMNLQEKLEMAHALKALGVDVIEAGFPIASPGDFISVQAIAREVHGPVIAGLARCNPADIDRAGEALRDAERSRIHVFLATSAIHREFKLKMTPAEIVTRAVEGIKRAKQYTDDIEFSPEDAARTELDFLAEVCERAVEAGATTLNIPDTVGYAVPEHYARIIRHLKTHVRGVEKVVLSVHCHNDLGLAVANSLAALQEGARQVECTINGIGERAGNCALEEIVMALRTRQDYFGLTTGINTRLLFPTSRKLTHVTGMQVQRNKAIVGQNAFAHEAGIHQDGMLKERSTYEIMKPEDVGITKTELVLGKHSGRHALRSKVIELGYHLDDSQLQQVFDAFKGLADRKKHIYDADIEALVESQLHAGTGTAPLWTLEAFTCNAGTGTLPSAAVALWHQNGNIIRDSATGDGPVDALFKTIERITGIDVELLDYRIRSVTVGEDAQGEATVEVSYQGRKLSARAVSTDIIEASALAFLETINRILLRKVNDRLKPTDDVPQELVPNTETTAGTTPTPTA
ncbi:2-isopropylmalate synthase [Tuwongella immobilis]|uniref:2-isopropylmalate synthase n=1 Tax=Tuwongella immobilis TaxID=692036 RepID=A0A6C2YTR0_9BACT|nr:2-isopropylmalate synthase [Tuwongella immobilis]VIP04272.1 2-isopropylmalate synthase : 2-isopropylmalate synthase OS=Cystobacter fuscus DSM 2262 GN=leuA PE=3 SV=1: HMGL-like: LeuA_dimer [Tuwongella immobilis]VTS05907.1 2-isopropylmalate synthase : 2-isopropylmalate synthase OS=Cystobacter fuscus DSM 2262 GN=leuA PE=3 SV=1: HMGL-like: LeuA_dimer [Tuwongella immobilis]